MLLSDPYCSQFQTTWRSVFLQEYKYVEDCQVAKVMDHQLRRIEKAEAELKQLRWFQIITVSLLGLVTYQCHSEVSRLDKEVAAPKSESP